VKEEIETKRIEMEAGLMPSFCQRCRVPYDVKSGPINSISHGFCPECFETEMNSVKSSLPKQGVD